MPGMNIDLTKPWKEVFALVAEAKADEKRKKRAEEELEELDRQDREKHLATEKHEKDEQEQQALEQMLATTQRLADFSSRLDDFDTASVKALMHNGEELDQVRTRLDAMLERADQLPDGRRVFKTEDGMRVFDEHGAELPADVIDPHSIDDHRPRWEPLKALRADEAKLQEERRAILDYQEKLDQTRARIDKGGITNKELDALDADLKSTMPAAVRDSLGHRGAEADGPGMGTQDRTATIQPLDGLRATAPVGPSPIH